MAGLPDKPFAEIPLVTTKGRDSARPAARGYKDSGLLNGPQQLGRTKHLMAKAVVAVYEAVAKDHEDRPA